MEGLCLSRGVWFLDLLPSQPALFSKMWSISFWMMILALFYFGYKKIRSINDRRTLVFWKDGTHSIKNYRIKDGKLQIRSAGIGESKIKAWAPQVKSENVIPAKRSFRSMLRPVGFKQKDMFIAVEDSPSLVSLTGLLEKKGKKIVINESLLLKTWSKEEIADYIKKALAQGTVQRKVFSDTQFYMFFFVLILNLFMTVLIIRAMGIL
jgi:hypothetical protein